ncbi:hypothetical protein SHI21_07215 [Bacteriovorax sp. PP10]|uniref:Membrane-anchored protein n=1 Tax=Bacteriovorax antarcticus TaxID=3088717 RepID=A0ABU5VTP9_9BACT|nr:hypothetical protein [Bacteriovorax sp. PP10]MEA9355982.1 hypothetical protein [Bacteriovorax sp. PP10]
MNTEIDSNKLPPVDIYFWIMIITATTLGETAGDLLSMTMKVGYAWSSVILIALFVIALGVQLVSKSKHRGLFWTVIILTSTAGTTVSDYITRSLELGYTQGSLLLLAILVAVFGLWRIKAKTLSIDSVKTVQVEALYWAAILFSSTLGTSLGDFLSDDTGLNLGFGAGTALLAALLLLIAVLTLFTKMSRVFLFWAAIIVTHPIGACMGDYLTKPTALGFGPLSSTIGLLLLFIMVATAIGYKNKTV